MSNYIFYREQGYSHDDACDMEIQDWMVEQ